MMTRDAGASGRDASGAAPLSDPALAALAALGAQLRGAGLTSRALAAWVGTARIAALPTRLDARTDDPPTPAAVILALFVAGAELARGQLSALPGALIDALIAQGLVEVTADRVRARAALLPLGAALLVCDRLDAAIERALVCWPDDSSHHLATAIPPGRRAHWLDLGCGSAFAALARPELAARITGVDVNERAVGYARLGAALSGIRHLEVALGDVGDGREPADLVTCNAPMPPLRTARAPHAVPEVWRQAEPGFFERLWTALPRAVRPGGLIVVHAACEELLPALGNARGERVAVTYTPEHSHGFAVAWWRPDAPDRFITAHRALTLDRPHLDPQDREDALAG
jgi:SAM-dependent methyltransferase